MWHCSSCLKRYCLDKTSGKLQGMGVIVGRWRCVCVCGGGGGGQNTKELRKELQGERDGAGAYWTALLNGCRLQDGRGWPCPAAWRVPHSECEWEQSCGHAAAGHRGPWPLRLPPDPLPPGAAQPLPAEILSAHQADVSSATETI